MPETLAAFVAFVAEHQRCGDLDTAIAKLRALAKEPHLHAIRRRA